MSPLRFWISTALSFKVAVGQIIKNNGAFEVEKTFLPLTQMTFQPNSHIKQTIGHPVIAVIAVMVNSTAKHFLERHGLNPVGKLMFGTRFYQTVEDTHHGCLYPGFPKTGRFQKITDAKFFPGSFQYQNRPHFRLVFMFYVVNKYAIGDLLAGGDIRRVYPRNPAFFLIDLFQDDINPFSHPFRNRKKALLTLFGKKRESSF
jgi:hypothetical protein